MVLIIILAALQYTGLHSHKCKIWLGSSGKVGLGLIGHMEKDIRTDTMSQIVCFCAVTFCESVIVKREKSTSLHQDFKCLPSSTHLCVTHCSLFIELQLKTWPNIALVTLENMPQVLLPSRVWRISLSHLASYRPLYKSPLRHFLPKLKRPNYIS